MSPTINKDAPLTTYSVNGVIASFTGGTDADNDGFFETYTFQVGIDGDISSGSATVRGKVICTTTGQSWWLPNSWIIQGTATDYWYYYFSQADFAGFVTGNTNLNFTVELWDDAQNILLATDTAVNGEPVKADYIPKTYSVSGMVNNFVGVTDADNDGYYETYSFQVGIDGDVFPGADTVYGKVICNTTGLEVWSSGWWIITGIQTDFLYFNFNQTNFPGITGNTNLDFKVELWNKTQTQLLATDESVYGEPVKVDHIASTTSYGVQGKINNLHYSDDLDHDGYYETYNFQIGIDGDAIPGPVNVYGKIICNTTGQFWWTPNYWTITGTGTDYVYTNFTQDDFAGYVTGNTNLDFTVELWDETKSIRLATDSTITGEPVKADFIAPNSVTITGLSPNIGSAGTNTQVTISGTNFGDPQGSGKVEFFYRTGQPGITATIISWHNTIIVCKVPVNPAVESTISSSSGPVKVTTNSGVVSNGVIFKVTFGYGLRRWAGTYPVVRYYINENCSSVTGEGAAIQGAANAWNGANSKFTFQYSGTTTATAPSQNNRNEIFWQPLPSGVFAQPYVWYDDESGNVVEYDLAFNSSILWSAGGTRTGLAYDIQSVATNEFGHWLSLRDLFGSLPDNEHDLGKVMYGINATGTTQRNLDPEDILGISWIYGNCQPVSPGPITGNTNVCEGSLQGYGVLYVPNAIYSWQFPSGWTIHAGGSSPFVVVNAGHTSGTIQVTLSFPCGAPSTSSKVVIVTPLPSQTDSIMGEKHPCQGSSQNYSVTSVSGWSYDWTVPNGWTLQNESTTNQITVTAGSSAGLITVTPSNGCGNGPTSSLPVSPATVPIQPGLINGPATPCPGSLQSYYVTAVPGVSYTWSFPPGWVQTGGGTTNYVMVIVGSSPGEITVTPANLCGHGNSSVLHVAPAIQPGSAGPISGPATYCSTSVGNMQLTYSIPSIYGAIGYFWTVPDCMNIVTGQGTTSIVVTSTGCSGQISVYGYNYYCSGAACSLTVSVGPRPVPTVTGPSTACSGSTGNNYLTEAGMTNYSWTLPTGGSITGGGNSSSSYAAVTWNTTGQKAVCANYFNNYGCNASSPACKNDIIINTPPAALNTLNNIIVKPGDSFCSDAFQTLTVAGNGSFYWVEGGGSVEFIAGGNIRLLSGVKVFSGGYLYAHITQACLFCESIPNKSVAANLNSDNHKFVPASFSENDFFFKIYPNPTTATFILDVSASSGTQIATVDIFGIHGEKVIHTDIDIGAKHAFSLDGKPTGLYFLKVYCGNRSGTQKIIKLQN